MAAFRIAWQTIRHLNHRGYIYIWANLICAACMLPIVTAPAAWAGLVYLTYQMHRAPHADLNDYWQGFRENLRRGLWVTLLNAAVISVNVVNLMAYRDLHDPFTDAMRFVWFGTLALWFTVQLYLWPILMHMVTPTLKGALRNALVMVILNPVFTLVVWVILFALWSLSTLLVAAWLLLTLSVMSIFLTRAVLDRLGVGVYIAEEQNQETAA